MTTLQKITTHLWFAEQAEQAAELYASLFSDSRIDRVTALPAETPFGPPGSVHMIDFTLAGQQCMALNAGPRDPFNHALSLVVNCDDQAEIDWLWDALSNGGEIEQCGWLKDRYGLSWQIVPTVLREMMQDPDRAREHFRTSGEGYSSEEVHTYLRNKTRGQPAMQAKPRAWRE